jgi:hypothetical protein
LASQSVNRTLAALDTRQDSGPKRAAHLIVSALAVEKCLPIRAFPPGRTLGEHANLFLVPARTCAVSFTDHEGLRHPVNVNAEMLYEAVALAVRAFREHDCAPGLASVLDVEARRPSVTHTVAMRKVREWLDGGAKSPKEKVMKERLKGLLA